MPRKRVTTPFELKVREEIKTLDRTQKMDKELSKYGKPVPSGMVWSRADLARFFIDQKKKKK